MKLCKHRLQLTAQKILASSIMAACFCAAAMADTLSDIYELALQNDATLKRAEATYSANIEIEKQAFSTMLPQIDSQTYYQKSEVDSDSFTFGQTAPIRFLSNTDTSGDGYSLTLSQRIFDLPAWFTLSSAKETSKQAKAQLAFDQQDLMVRVTQAYFDVLRAKNNLRASMATEVATKRQLEQNEQQYRVGLLAKTDLHEARAVYNSIVVQRLSAEGNLEASYEALTVLTGQAHANLWSLSEDFPVMDPDPVDRSEWVQFALQNNYALKAAVYAMEAARQTATAEKSEHLPKISGSFQYLDENVDGTILTSINSPFTTIPPTYSNTSEIFSINLTMPIFSGGAISSRRRQSYQQYNAALQRKIETQRSIIRTTRASHITVTTDIQRIKASEKAIISARSALKATEAGYQFGTRTIVDVLDAHRRLYVSIRDYANARYDYVVDMFTLKQAAGTLSPEDISDINQWLTNNTPTEDKYNDALNEAMGR